MRRLTLLAMTLLLVGCAEASTQTPTPVGDVSVSIEYTYYQVTGPTTEELRAQMDQSGYTDESGDHWDAYTEWYVSWAYPYSVEHDACTTGPVEVAIEVTVVFPKWEPPPGTSQELIERWNAYLVALEDHEAGHKEIAIAAGYEVLRTIDALPAYKTCDELELAADAAADRVLQQHRQEEAIYDQETKHGISQGASFP
jgi:predicted secreted Zn-dependent protease